MTVKQLLDSLLFDEIAPCIIKCYEGDEEAESVLPTTNNIIQSIMSQMIKYGSELIRIKPKDNRRLEYSKDNGSTFCERCSGSSVYGNFIELMDNGPEILAITDVGLYYSKDRGSTWYLRKRD